MSQKQAAWPKVRSIAIGIACVGLIAISCHSSLEAIKNKTHTLEQLAQVQTAHKQAVNTNREAQQAYQMVKDPDYLAQIARKDYFYSKEGEIIFDFVEEDNLDNGNIN